MFASHLIIAKFSFGFVAVGGLAQRSQYRDSLLAGLFGGRFLVAERSKATVCGRSLAGFAGSNPGGGMDVCVACCKYRQKRQNAGQ